MMKTQQEIDHAAIVELAMRLAAMETRLAKVELGIAQTEILSLRLHAKIKKLRQYLHLWIGAGED